MAANRNTTVEFSVDPDRYQPPLVDGTIPPNTFTLQASFHLPHLLFTILFDCLSAIAFEQQLLMYLGQLHGFPGAAAPPLLNSPPFLLRSFEFGDLVIMASGKRENEARGHGLGDQNEQVDAAVLHHQNQRLVQQLEAQKAEMHTLEGKFKELREEQDSYDKTLITVNKMWNQLVDDLVLLGVRAGGDLRYLPALDREDLCLEAFASCPPEDTFLYRLLRAGPIEKNEGNGTIKYVQEALALRHSATLDLMKHVQETIAARRAKNDCLAMALHGKLSSEDAIMQVQKLNEYMREVANNMHQAIDILHQKHKQYTHEIDKYLERHSREQSEIKRLSGELEESMAELEESRRKLAILQMQKHGTSVMNASVASAVNGSNSLDKPADRTVGLRELKNSVEEAKTLAASRLSELQEAQEENLNMSKQVEDLQNKLKDDKYIVTSKPYSLLSDKLQQLNMELEQYKGLMESLQAERNHILRREKELNARAESADAAKISLSTYEAKIEELELQIQKFIAERNDLEIKLEEAVQDSGRKDIKDEIHVMASALYKEMEMLETQLNRSKIAARDALKSREEADSLRAILDRKISEHKILSDKCAEQVVEIKSYKAQIEKLEKEKQELQIFLDMYAQECFDTRHASVLLSLFPTYNSRLHKYLNPINDAERSTLISLNL
ncbi:putative E3 ubiquitin-protein ligase BRE1-like 2 [Cocos nucifera]|uniref:E3 ubiquitin protein ligase n=1 Tax=Cocos nucifera TaxID=13894 RepID=A0A8K0I976_COCNU|nr:putative E3 ubiquitin-protein ligase BRE1-like 2 [Cocos nucifera]